MEDAVRVLDWMDKVKVRPNATLYLCLLKPCKDPALGKRIHSHILTSGVRRTLELRNSLLNMYAKCGRMDDARSVFDSMEVKSVVSWTAMIAGYGQNGNGMEAISLFKQMLTERV